MKKKRLNLIKEVLADMEMTQQALANKAGLTFAAVNSYYHGKREPSLPTLMQIAKALNISPRDLIPDKA
jgi:transcriptional regulator with XRE-family HTH domain